MSLMEPEPATPNPSQNSIKSGGLKQFVELFDMIKFEHTVFALPFAFTAALAAAQGLPPWRTVGWILAAMVGARTAAMTFNRLADAELDGENPRTANRALPAGRVSHWAAWAMLGLSIILFSFSAGMLGPLPWKLTPLALVILLGYSLCKRFTSWSHAVLGLALAGAPLGAWIAVAGTLEGPVWPLAFGVLAWTTGFDILYALQDQEFDRTKGLHSIPVRLGTLSALRVARLCHMLALGAWALFNFAVGAHLFPWAAWVLILFILGREHWVVRGGRLERIDHAFFTLNSLVGVVFFLGHALEWVLFSSRT
jgi:4-hydroxybenzoate polyprenyltransferase